MTTPTDHPVPVLACGEHDGCRSWSARMLADDDRDLEELLLTLERATTTLTLHLSSGQLTVAPVTTTTTACQAHARHLWRLLAVSRMLHLTAVQASQLHTDLDHHHPEEGP